MNATLLTLLGYLDFFQLQRDMGRSRGNFHSNDEDPTSRFEIYVSMLFL